MKIVVVFYKCNTLYIYTGFRYFHLIKKHKHESYGFTFKSLTSAYNKSIFFGHYVAHVVSGGYADLAGIMKGSFNLLNLMNLYFVPLKLKF